MRQGAIVSDNIEQTLERPEGEFFDKQDKIVRIDKD